MRQWFIQHIKQNRYFYVPLLFFYTFSFFRMFLYSKIQNHLFFNQIVGNKYIDIFFKYLTYLGDGWFVIFVGVLWLFRNIRNSIFLISTYAVAGGITSLLKNYIFDVPRPHFVFDYFHKDIFVKYVDGVELLALNSFPSGHSTAAFVLSTFLALQTNNNIAKCIFSIAGICIAFSRVYLSQHWLNDIVAGTLIGWIITILLYYLFTTRFFSLRLNKNTTFL